MNASMIVLLVICQINGFFGGMTPKVRKHAIEHIMPIVIEESQNEGVDPLLVSSIIIKESGYRPNVIGKNGEIGLMQINRKNRPELFDPRLNIQEGVRILKEGLDKCKIWMSALNYYRAGFCTPILAKTVERYAKYKTSSQKCVTLVNKQEADRIEAEKAWRLEVKQSMQRADREFCNCVTEEAE